jgi:Restriction Enzyme Adenine Methylase Associated
MTPPDRPPRPQQPPWTRWNPNRDPTHTDPAIGASEPQDEAALREWGGLAPDAVILAPPLASAAPMRLPERVWALLVVAVDIVDGTDPDRAGEVALFAEAWVPEQPPAELYDGDLMVRLTHPAEPSYPLPRDHAVDVEMLLAYHGRWQRVGQWRGVDDQWPRLVAPSTALTIALHTAAAEAVIPQDATPSTTIPPMESAYGGLSALLDAGWVSPGEEVVWHCRHHGVRHPARIRRDGTLLLADGRVRANPTGATTALGGHHQNGWNAWRRSSDGRTLSELRTELQARRRRSIPCLTPTP